MYSKKLSPVIDIKGCNNLEDILELTYKYFKDNIMNKNKRPILFGKFIYIPFDFWIQNKAEMYWHMISLRKDERFNILPCNNDVSSMYKSDNCLNNNHQIEMKNGQIRNICLYRAIRINWFVEIINLANNHDRNVKYWEKGSKLYLRFQHETVDYAIVFDIQKNNYRLLSMFPMFYINKKKDFDNDYNDYQK